MPVTKREIAEKFGVTKRTVANYVSRMGLEDHVTRNGQTDILDDYAAAALADALGKKGSVTEVPAEETETEKMPATDPVITALGARIEDLKAENARLAAELAEARLSREHEVAELRSQLAQASERAIRLAERLAGIAERQQVIAAMPWWRRGTMAMRLLGPGE